jgi:predicted component of type VI protein secretion system
MNMIDLASFIFSSKEMQFQWYDDSELRNMVFQNISRCLSDKAGMEKAAMTRAGRQPIVTILKYFGETNMKWVELPEELRTNIQNALAGFSHHFNHSDQTILSTTYD